MGVTATGYNSSLPYLWAQPYQTTTGNGLVTGFDQFAEEPVAEEPAVSLTFGADVERNIADYLRINFDSPEFAARWHEIHIGSSNREFLLRAKDALNSAYARVIDLGTGTAKALLPIANAIKRGLLVGIDRSGTMLAVAEQNLAEQYPYLDRAFINGDVTALDGELPPRFKDFDAAVARFLFNFVDLDVVLPQVFSRLRTTGKLIFNVFSGFHHGYTDDFKAANPFEEARIKVAKEVLEELVIPQLSEEDRQRLIADGHIRAVQNGRWEILAEPVTQKEGLDRAALERSLKKAGFEDVLIEPVEEMYPAVEKQKSFLLTGSIPYFWPVTNLLSDRRELRLRLVEEIWRRMPEEFKSGEHKFTDIFVSARKPEAARANAEFIAATAAALRDKPEEVSEADIRRFFGMIAPNPETFVKFFREGRLPFRLTPMDDVYAGYGREVNMQLNRDNAYAFLEPILKFVLKERPDEIFIVDRGARPFEQPIRTFLKEFGLDTSINFVNVSVQSNGQDAADVYEALKRERERIAGRHVMVIDDNVVRLRTAPIIENALRALGAKRVSVSAVAAFNDAAYRFLDVATVRLPGNSLWIDPKRGLVSWTEWEENPSLILDQAYLDELAKKFESDLKANKRRLQVADIPNNTKVVRRPISRDNIVIMDFIADGSNEADFIDAVRYGSAKFENTGLRRLIDEYASGAFNGKWSLERRDVRVGERTITLDPSLDLRSILRQYLLWGNDGVDLLRNKDVLNLRMLEGENDRGSVRIARVYDMNGRAHLVLDRFNPDFKLDVDPEKLVDGVLTAVSEIATSRGYIFKLASGRDATFSKVGKYRDVFNARFKRQRLSESAPVLLKDKRGASLLAGVNEHLRGEVPFTTLAASLTGMPQFELGARIFSTELAEVPPIDAPREGLLRYFAIAPELRTYFTNLLLKLEQVLGERVQMLRPHHITEPMRGYLASPDLRKLLETSFVDLKELVFEHDSLAALVYNSAQNMLFGGEDKIDFYRVHINMTTLNEKDDTNFHGGLYLSVVKQWFQENFGKVYTVQNPERTTFEFIAQSPRQVRAALANYEIEVRARMVQAAGVDPEIVDRFMPKVVLSTRSLTHANFFHYAVRTDEDREAFKEVIELIERTGWPGVSAVLNEKSPRLNNILNAMIFKAVLELNAELAAQTNYFEKRVGFGKMVYFENELPNENEPGFADWKLSFLESRMGFVGPGRYDPAYHNKELASSPILEGSFLDIGLDPRRPQSAYRYDSTLHPLVNRLLKAFPPYRRIAGFISRRGTERGDRDEGGLIEQFLRKQDRLARAGTEDVPILLVEWKELASELLHAFRNFYRWAITEPRNGWILKSHEDFDLPRGNGTVKVNANFLVQELALQGNRFLVTLEYDSFRAFTQTHVGEVIGKSGAANYVDDKFFNMVRDAFFLVAARMNAHVEIGLPILTAPGGDHMSISLTLGDSVDPVAYLNEVKGTVQEMFKEYPYRDLHKVDLREMRLSGSGIERLKDGAFREQMRKDMNLASQPQVAAVNEGSVTVAVAVVDRNGREISSGAVIDYLKGAGISVTDVAMLGVEKYRLPMWKNSDDFVFGETWPDGYEPFTKVLTISMALAEHEPIKRPSDVPAFLQVQKKADKALGAVKKETWPNKGGFVDIRKPLNPTGRP